MKNNLLNQQHSFDSKDIDNPYLRGIQDWDNQYGGLLKAGKSWRLAFFVLLAALIYLVVIGNNNSAKSADSVHLVILDEHRQVVFSGKPKDANLNKDEVFIFTSVEQIVLWIRSIPADLVTARGNWENAFSHFTDTLANRENLKNSKDDPLEKVGVKVREVHIDTSFKVPNTDHIIQVRWTETERNTNGVLISEKHMAGLFSYLYLKPSEKQAKRNPLGFYLNDYRYEEER